MATKQDKALAKLLRNWALRAKTLRNTGMYHAVRYSNFTFEGQCNKEAEYLDILRKELRDTIK